MSADHGYLSVITVAEGQPISVMKYADETFEVVKSLAVEERPANDGSTNTKRFHVLLIRVTR